MAFGYPFERGEPEIMTTGHQTLIRLAQVCSGGTHAHFVRYNIAVIAAWSQKPGVVETVLGIGDGSWRIGGLEDQDLVLRSLGRPRRVTVASPDYLTRMGRPRTPEDLPRHQLVDFLLPHPGERLEWEFEEGGKTTACYPLAIAAVSDANARVELAVAGMGIVQTLSFIAAPALRDKKLVRILSKWEALAPAISILYPRDHHLPARTQATMDTFASWISEAIKASP